MLVAVGRHVVGRAFDGHAAGVRQTNLQSAVPAAAGGLCLSWSLPIFRRNDDLLNLLPKGVIAFPGSGITDNLVDKAKRLGIPVCSIT